MCLVLGYCTSTWQASADNRGLALINQWSQLEFEYSSELARRQAISSGEFNPEHTVPIDVDVFYTGRYLQFNPEFHFNKPIYF